MKALIVDGDPYPRVRLGVLLRERPDLEVVGECEGGFEAVEAFATMRPDLLIVGHAPKDLTPIEVLVAISDPAGARCLLALDAGSELAIATDAAGLGVLPVPFDRATFRSSIDRTLASQPPSEAELERQLRVVIETTGQTPPRPRRLLVRSNRRVELVRTRDIDWIGAARNYVKLHVGETTHRMRATMTSVERRLDPREFLRIHRSIIVNVDRMREIQPWFHGEAVVILEDGTRLNLSRSYRPRVERYLSRVAKGLG
jgi:two-component system LytT family response regulator